MQTAKGTSLQPRLIWRGHAHRLLSAALAALFLLLAGCGTGTLEQGDEIRLLVTPVPTPTVTLAAQPTAAPVTYTVKTGDTLSGIADMFGVTVDDIVRLNNIADPNSLSLGQALTIPQRQAATAAPGATITAVASPGAPQQTPGAGPPVADTVTPVLISPTVLPVNVTPPQGPPLDSPSEVSPTPGP